MTLIKYSGLVSDNRGKLNGSIFSKVRAGNVIKNFRNPYNPRSSSQQPNRQNWQLIVRNWQLLSDTERASWVNLANGTTWHNKLGTAYHPTGQQLYLYCNQNVYSINAAFLPSAVGPVATELIRTAYVTEQLLGDYALFINYSTSPISTKVKYKLYASPCLSPGISYSYKYLKLIKIIPAGTVSPVAFTTDYLNLFPQPTTGKKIFFKLTPVEILSGFSSVSVYCNIIAGNYNPSPFIIPFQFGFSF